MIEMGCGTGSLGCGRGVDAGIKADVVENGVGSRHKRQGTRFLIVLARVHAKGINNVRFVRDSELGAVNGAKPESMPGFEFRMGSIVRINRLPVKIDKSSMR